MSVITNQPSTRHAFDIHNGAMECSVNLPQYHTEGYAQGVGFNYGFIQNHGVDTETEKHWHPLRGNTIEYWRIPSEGISCIELNANSNSKGIKQKLMSYGTELEIAQHYQFAQGFYLITWKDRCRRGDNTHPVVDNSYNVRVTLGDPSETSTLIVEHSVSQDEMVEGEWKTRHLLVQITRENEFNEEGKDIWLSLDSNAEDTFGALITDVRVCPIILSDGIFSLISPDEDIPNMYSIAWIKPSVGDDGEPAMPNLNLAVQNLDFSEFSIQANLNVTYNRPHITGASPEQQVANAEVIAKDTLNFPADGSRYSLQEGNWHIAGSTDWLSAVNEGFFGGSAILTIAIYQNDLEICNVQYPFRIAGLNPDDDVCEEFIRAHLGEVYADTLNSMAWVIPAIGKHESMGYGGEITSLHPFSWHNPRNVFYNQFCEGGSKSRHRRGFEGMPVYHDDGHGAGGYGIFQVTGDTTGIYTAIPRAQIWNWQDNVKAAMLIILQKYRTASAWMNRQIGQQMSEAPTKTLPLYIAGDTQPQDGAAYYVEITANGEKTMTHLCTLKAYNGASSPSQNEISENATKYRSAGFRYDKPYGHYCTWANSQQEWCICRHNSLNFDYVDRVLSCINL